jgi:hypothetical protein
MSYQKDGWECCAYRVPELISAGSFIGGADVIVRSELQRVRLWEKYYNCTPIRREKVKGRRRKEEWTWKAVYMW